MLQMLETKTFFTKRLLTVFIIFINTLFFFSSSSTKHFSLLLTFLDFFCLFSFFCFHRTCNKFSKYSIKHKWNKKVKDLFFISVYNSLLSPPSLFTLFFSLFTLSLSPTISPSCSLLNYFSLVCLVQ
jgi:hypothetical protein